MPQDDVAGVNGGSGDLNTPREVSASSILHVRRLPACPLRPLEDRSVVNAGSKECSRCDLPVHLGDADQQLPSSLSMCCLESSRTRRHSFSFTRDLHRTPSTPCAHSRPRDDGASTEETTATPVMNRGAVNEARHDDAAAETTRTAAAAAAATIFSVQGSPTRATSTIPAPASTPPAAPTSARPPTQDVDSTAPPGLNRPRTSERRVRPVTSTTLRAPPAARATGQRRAQSLGPALNLRQSQQWRSRPNTGDAAANRARRAAAPSATADSAVAERPRTTWTHPTTVASAPAIATGPAAPQLATTGSHGSAHSVAPTPATEAVWYAVVGDAPGDDDEADSPTVASAVAAAGVGTAVHGVWVDTAAIPDDLICGICLQLAEQPHTTDCGHLFCRHCIAHWLGDHPQCPTDRQPLLASQVRYDRRAERQIRALRCHCAAFQPLQPATLGAPVQLYHAPADGTAGAVVAATRTPSCTWTGCISDAITHMLRCPEAPVRCPFTAYGCHVVARRHDMPRHVASAAISHNALLLRTLATLEKQHRELVEEVDVLRLRSFPTTLVPPPPHAASTAMHPLSPLGSPPAASHVDLHRHRARRHTSPTLPSLMLPTVQITARYVWAITDFANRLGRRPRRQATSARAGARLIYSPAFNSAPLPGAVDVREFLESSFSFSSLSSGPVPGPDPASIRSLQSNALEASEASVGSDSAQPPPPVPPQAQSTFSDHNAQSANAPLQWYLGLTCHAPADAEADVMPCWDIYLFGHRHPYRTVFRLTVFHGTDPSRDIVHLVDDWQPSFMGKGWGPTHFIDPSRLEREGYVVRDCLRVGVDIIGTPF